MQAKLSIELPFFRLAFDPNQERDANGRFAGGDASGFSTPKAFKGTLYHGKLGRLKIDPSRDGVLFMSESRSGASWYAIDRGEGYGQPTITHAAADLHVGSQKDLDRAVKELGVTSKDIDAAGGDSDYPYDALHVPMVRDYLKSLGFDGIRGSDILGSSEIGIVAIFNPKKIRDVTHEEIKDYVLAFDPNQERDYRGRFAPSDGGEGAGGGSSTPTFARAIRVGKEWRLANGKPLPAHLPKNIPPAWRSVQVATDPKAALLVKGVDAKGRTQSVYSPSHSAKQAALKFARVNELRSKVDAIKKEIKKDMDDGVEEAFVLALIEHTGIRPGSETDTGAEKQAYGATTLQASHVVKTPIGVRLQFVGKKGVDLDIPVMDPALAKMLLDRKAKGGKLFDTSDSKLRDYTHEKDGGSFKPKDFRTARGTSLAAQTVKQMPTPKDEASYKKAVREVAVKVSTQLGNTPAIALQSYIDPSVFAQWRKTS